MNQYHVCELEENSNCIVDDVQYVSAVQEFDPFTVKVSFTEEAPQEISNIEHLQYKHDAYSSLQAQPISWSIVRNGVIFSNEVIFLLLHLRTPTIFLQSQVHSCLSFSISV